MYCLLPFRFRPIQDKEILVSELGNYLIVPRGTAANIVNRKIDLQCDLYKDEVHPKSWTQPLRCIFYEERTQNKPSV